MFKTQIIVSAAVISTILCGTTFAENCPFMSNGDVWQLIKEGKALDDEKHMWGRVDVFVVDGKTHGFKSYYPRELYSEIITAGGHKITEQTDASGICVYEADITKVENQPAPKYYGDIVRVKTKRTN